MTSRSVGKTAQVRHPLGATSPQGILDFETIPFYDILDFVIVLPYINIEALLDSVTYWIL